MAGTPLFTGTYSSSASGVADGLVLCWTAAAAACRAAASAIPFDLITSATLKELHDASTERVIRFQWKIAVRMCQASIRRDIIYFCWWISLEDCR